MQMRMNNWLEQPAVLWKQHTSSIYQQVDASTSEVSTAEKTRSHTATPWIRTFWRAGPLLALSALALSVVCISMSFVVLLSSHGQEISSWPMQPSVYLSASAAVSNTALRFALAQALPIAWWLRAMRGASVKALHREWNIGEGILESILSLRRFGLVAMACVSTTLLILNGPLLQKASTALEMVPSNELQLNLRVVPELPTGWSGILKSSGNAVLSDSYRAVYKQYLRDTPIASNVTGCNGSCNATIRAPGLVADAKRCTHVEYPLDGYNDLENWPQEYDGEYLLFQVNLITLAEVPNSQTWFGPRIPEHIIPRSIAPRDSTRESVGIFVIYADVEDYVGTMTMSQCWFVPGILEYNVIVSDNGTKLRLDANQKDWPVYALANNTAPVTYNVSVDSTISNMVLDESIMFQSRYYFEGEPPGVVRQHGDLTTFAVKQVYGGQGADVSVKVDPTHAILARLNELMFRSGIAAVPTDITNNTFPSIDKGLSINQTVTGQRIDRLVVFASNYWWWTAASTLQLLALVLILSVLWGWWRLGREVTFSPLEIAKAFEAPILNAADSNGGANSIVKDLGHLHLRYGVKEISMDEHLSSGYQRGQARQRFAFGEYHEVSPPRPENGLDA